MFNLTTSALAAVVALVVYYFYRQHARGMIALGHGCQPPVKFQSLEPIAGFDFQLSIHADIPSLFRYHQKYGNTFQVPSLVNQPAISTIAPENLNVINSAGKDWGIQPLRLPAMEYFCGLGFLTTDGAVWQHSRKLLRPSFSMTNLQDLSALSTEVDRFFSNVPSDGSTVDLQPLLFAMFLNTSLRFLLGVDPADNTPGAPHSPKTFVDAFHDALFGVGMQLMLGRAAFLAPKAKYLQGCKVAHEFLDFFVNRALEAQHLDSKPREQGKPQQRSMIQGLAAQTDDIPYIRSQILQGMMAAQETTSVLIGNTMFLLSRNTSWWDQIRSEAIQRGPELMTFEALSSSKLLQNIIRETLRLYPIFPLLGRTALNDAKLPVGGGKDQKDPIFVPQGSMVLMSSYSLHRESSVFGEDVDDFNPDRWNSINPRQWEYLPFGGGQRACLGQQKVMAEAAYVLVRVAVTFTSLKSRDNKPWKGDLKLTCKNANGCKVALII